MAAVPEAEVAQALASQQRRSPREAARRPSLEDAPLDSVAHQTTQPILFKQRPVAAAIVLSLRAAAPPAVASSALYALAQLYRIPSTEFLSALTILVTVLSIVLLQPSRDPSVELLFSRRRIAINLIGRWTALLAVLAVLAYATDYTPRYPQQVILIWAAATPLLVIAATLGLHEVARRAICRPDNHRSVVFVGYNEASRYLAASFANRRELCMTVKGFFDDRSAGRLEPDARVQMLGALSDLPAYVKTHGVDVIFISLPLRHVRRVHDLVEALGDTTASLYYLPDVGASELVHARAGEILGLPVIVMRETPFYGYRGAAKRMLDVIVAGGALLALAPLLLAIAIGVKLTSRGPVLFRQRRYGLEGREIVIYKFRTMRVTEDKGWLAQARRDDPRVTPFGRFLRRWSLDELPQLINVLQGTMSLVGPRPHAIGHNEEYRRLIRGYMVRHKALPGLTGLAQVKGYRGETRTLAEMQARVHYDLEYLRNWSLALDLKILLLTLPKLWQTHKAY